MICNQILQIWLFITKLSRGNPSGLPSQDNPAQSREIICPLAAANRQALLREENQAQSARRAQEKEGSSQGGLEHPQSTAQPQKRHGWGAWLFAAAHLSPQMRRAENNQRVFKH